LFAAPLPCIPPSVLTVNIVIARKEKGNAALVELFKGKKIKPETVNIWQLDLP
jgi:hypothetical protein